MDEKRDTISRINEKFNKMSKSHKKLATFVIDHYEQAAFMTAAKLGKAVGISEATVVRFAYALDYEGYPEFQEALADDPAFAFICYVDANYVADSGIQGISRDTVMGHHGVGIFWNVAEWTME